MTLIEAARQIVRTFDAFGCSDSVLAAQIDELSQALPDEGTSMTVSDEAVRAALRARLGIEGPFTFSRDEHADMRRAIEAADRVRKISFNDPDEPIIDGAADDDPAWLRKCPKCGAEPETECTSLVSGCCFEGMHAERHGGVPTLPMVPSDEAMSAAFDAWHGYSYAWSNSQGEAMRRAIEAADKVRGGTLPMVPSEKALAKAVETYDDEPYHNSDQLVSAILKAAYAIDGAREKAGDWLEVFDEPSAQDAGGEGSSSVSALRALIHGFRNVTGDFGWCLVRRKELDAAMAELEALERK